MLDSTQLTRFSPATFLVEQRLGDLTLLLGLDDVNLAVELCTTSLHLLRCLLVEVNQRPVVGGHPLLGDAQQWSEHSDQKSENLFNHNLEVCRFGQT